jgi:hypothetical protein
MRLRGRQLMQKNNLLIRFYVIHNFPIPLCATHWITLIR